MNMVAIGDIVDFIGGGTPSRDVNDYWNGDIPWASVKDFKGRLIDSTLESITQDGLSNSSSTLIPAGHVIMPTRMALGKAAINSIDVAINQDLKALKPKREVDTRYLLHAVLSKAKEIQAHGKGATVQGITIESLSAIQIPLPPLEEQRRIAAILDKAYQVKELGRQRDLRINQLELGLFLELFGNPISNSLGWPTVNIGKIARVQTGNTPPRERREYFGDEVEWIKSDNLNNSSYYATKAAEYLSALGASLARIAPRNAILVTCIAGSPSCIGNCAMVDRAVAFNQQINSLEDIDGNPHFFYAMLRLFKGIVQAASTNSMKGMVSKSRFESICIINPPRERQDLFAAKMAIVQLLQHQANELPTRADSLIQGLHKDIFMGPQVL